MSKNKVIDEELAVGTVIFTAGNSKQQADYWDDSELIDHWDKTVEAYRKQYSNQAEQSTIDPPYHQNKTSHKAKQGHIKKTKPISRKKTFEPSKPALRKGIEKAINENKTTKAQESTIPPLPANSSSSNDQENLSNLMMAWYYCGYYTGLYQGQK